MPLTKKTFRSGEFGPVHFDEKDDYAPIHINFKNGKILGLDIEAARAVISGLKELFKELDHVCPSTTCDECGWAPYKQSPPDEKIHNLNEKG